MISNHVAQRFLCSVSLLAASTPVAAQISKGKLPTVALQTEGAPIAYATDMIRNKSNSGLYFNIENDQNNDALDAAFERGNPVQLVIGSKENSEPKQCVDLDAIIMFQGASDDQHAYTYRLAAPLKTKSNNIDDQTLSEIEKDGCVIARHPKLISRRLEQDTPRTYVDDTSHIRALGSSVIRAGRNKYQVLFELSNEDETILQKAAAENAAVSLFIHTFDQDGDGGGGREAVPLGIKKYGIDSNTGRTIYEFASNAEEGKHLVNWTWGKANELVLQATAPSQSIMTQNKKPIIKSFVSDGPVR